MCLIWWIINKAGIEPLYSHKDKYSTIQQTISFGDILRYIMNLIVHNISQYIAMRWNLIVY